MRTLIKYKSDKTSKTVTEEIFLEHIPQPRVGDKVMAEGRPRQVSKRHFHVLGEDASGPWWPVGHERDDEPVVEIFLIG